MIRSVWILWASAALLAPRSVASQPVFDLAAAWGERERTVDIGGGYTKWRLTAAGGLATVERGLAPGYEWTEDKTKVIETATKNQVDPRDARTVPKVRVWGRLEYQQGRWGGALMWDPRNHMAGGAFGRLPLAARMEGIGEVRWVHTLGWLAAVRLRFR